MSQSHEHESTFGGIPILIRVAPFGAATLFVIKDNGGTLQPIADREGRILQILARDQRVDALGHAIQYLTKRFGARGQARATTIAPRQRHELQDPYMEFPTDI